MAHKSEPQVDAALIRQLADLLSETGLTEIEYGHGEMRIRVARHAAPVAAMAYPTAPSPASAPAAAGASEADLGPGEPVKSPMVGTVYLAPEPGAPSFVRAGEQVNQGQTLLIIEAMKVMNQIRAPKAGRIARILVADGAPVEFGEVLVLID